MLPYEVGSQPSRGFNERNGRSLTDNPPDVMFSTAANAPIHLGIGKESIPSKPVKDLSLRSGRGLRGGFGCRNRFSVRSAGLRRA